MSDSVTPWTPRFPAFRYLLEFAHTHVQGASDAIQPSHPLLPPSHFPFFNSCPCSSGRKGWDLKSSKSDCRDWNTRASQPVPVLVICKHTARACHACKCNDSTWSTCCQLQLHSTSSAYDPPTLNQPRTSRHQKYPEPYSD